MANFTHQQCDALRRLNPNVVSIWGDQASDKDGNSISYDLNAVNAEVDNKLYQYQRVTGVGTTSGYPTIESQLDQLYHDINSGKFGADAKTGDWFVGISSVKTSLPKP
tara:strand:- start:687 stop:1010 length:324 start_codon:yes stop_codon:yes gene_type:complete